MTDADLDKLVNAESAKPIAERKYLTREQLADMRGATSDDVTKLEAFAGRYHLKVTGADRGARTVSLSGSIADLEAAFGVALHTYQSKGATFRDHVGSVTLPADIAPIVRGVFGLSTRPAAKHHD
jgi:kumamolisin